MTTNYPSKTKTALPLELDYQATTPCDEEVLASMEPYWDKYWGNASSKQNKSGITAGAAVSLAREQLASLMKVPPSQIIFTSGVTESNNLALIGHARAMAKKNGKPGHIVTLETEHHAVLDPLRQLKREGFRLTEIRPNSDGILTKNQLLMALEIDTFLVSIMTANNEIGVLQPIEDLASICQEKGIIFHSDAAQAFGHLDLNPFKIGLDLMSINAHKMYGPKGIGALVIKPNTRIMPLQWGGGQEEGIRPGTLPVPLIIGFAKAAEISIREISSRQKQIKLLRDELLQGLIERIPKLLINGSLENRLPQNLNITIPDISGSQLHKKLRPLMSCSSGSACSRGEPSHVLKALGRSKAEAESSLRLSLGKDTSRDTIREAISIIEYIFLELKSN